MCAYYFGCKLFTGFCTNCFEPLRQRGYRKPSPTAGAWCGLGHVRRAAGKCEAGARRRNDPVRRLSDGRGIAGVLRVPRLRLHCAGRVLR